MSCSDKCSIKLSKSTAPTTPGEDCALPELPLIIPVGDEELDSPANCDYFDDEKYLLTMGIDAKTVLPGSPSNTQSGIGLGTNIEMYFPYSVFGIV